MSEQHEVPFTTAASVGRVMVESGGTSLARVDAVGAVLRHARLLPAGGRGLHAPLISLSQGLGFLLVTAATPRIQDTLETWEKIERMWNAPVSEPLTLWLMGKIRNEGEHIDIADLLINPVAGYAVARMTRGPELNRYFAFPEFWHGRAGDELPGGGFVGQCGLIGGEVLARFARAIETRTLEIKE